MPAHTGKIMSKKTPLRELSPEIPTPRKPSNILDNDIENTMPIDEKVQASCVDKIDINPLTIILANGQPLLTNFEEKYLIDLILKTTNNDIEKILQEKIEFILKLNYGSQSSGLFTLDFSWIFDFILKHFQTLTNHMNSQELFEKILKKNFDKNNSILTFKHWQLQTLVNEHSKKQQHQQSVTQKRRMTVRHIDFN